MNEQVVGMTAEPSRSASFGCGELKGDSDIGGSGVCWDNYIYDKLKGPAECCWQKIVSKGH